MPRTPRGEIFLRSHQTKAKHKRSHAKLHLGKKSQVKLIIPASSLPWRAAVATSAVVSAGLASGRRKNERSRTRAADDNLLQSAQELWLRGTQVKSTLKRLWRGPGRSQKNCFQIGFSRALLDLERTLEIWMGTTPKLEKPRRIGILQSIILSSCCVFPKISHAIQFGCHKRKIPRYKYDKLLDSKLSKKKKKTECASAHMARRCAKQSAAAVEATSWREHFKGNPFAVREVWLWRGEHSGRLLGKVRRVHQRPQLWGDWLFWGGSGRKMRARVRSQTDRQMEAGRLMGSS